MDKVISWCPVCGPEPRCDEDGCCATCGATTGQVPDWRAIESEVERLKKSLILIAKFDSGDADFQMRAMRCTAVAAVGFAALEALSPETPATSPASPTPVAEPLPVGEGGERRERIGMVRRGTSGELEINDGWNDNYRGHSDSELWLGGLEGKVVKLVVEVLPGSPTEEKGR